MWQTTSKLKRVLLAYNLSKQSDWLRNSELGIRKTVSWAGPKGQIRRKLNKGFHIFTEEPGHPPTRFFFMLRKSVSEKLVVDKMVIYRKINPRLGEDTLFYNKIPDMEFVPVLCISKRFYLEFSVLLWKKQKWRKRKFTVF